MTLRDNLSINSSSQLLSSLGRLSHGLLPSPIKKLLRAVNREMQMTPMKRVLRELKKRKVDLKSMHVLELFGNSGDGHIKDYVREVSTVEVWEIEPKYEATLTRNFPSAKVKITDSYKEIQNVSAKYDMIVVDNGTSIHGEYCEHFDLFPDIFSVARHSSILVLNVIPEVESNDLKRYPYLFSDKQLARRSAFYLSSHPEKISLDDMLMVYRGLIMENGFRLEWHFFQKRTFIYYLVLKIRREVFGNDVSRIH